MKPLQKRKCELFVYNRSIVKQNFKRIKPVLISLSSEAYSSLLYVFDTNKVLKQRENIKLKKTVATDLIATRMSLRDKSNADRIYDIYIEIKKRLKNPCRECYVQYAACILAEYTDGTDSARVAHLATKQFESIRDRKSAMRCANDLTVSSLLSICVAKNRYETSDDIAECIKELKERDVPSVASKYVSRILSFGKGVASARCDRFIRILELLKERDVRLGTGKETIAVAFASLIDIPDEILADSIAEVNNYFEKSKAFNSEIINTRRSMYSVFVACDELISDIDDPTLLLIKEATFAYILSFGI